MEKENFEALTRKVYATALPFPLSYKVRSHMRDEVSQQLASSGVAKNAAAVQREASEICLVLATLLGENAYMNGVRACSLDATAFAWLSVALYAPMPETSLRDCVRAHGVLVRFVERMLRECFGGMVPAARTIAVEPVRNDGFAAAWDTVVPLVAARDKETARERRRRQRQFFALASAVVVCGSFYLSTKLHESTAATFSLT
jgi:hypothetical protein